MNAGLLLITHNNLGAVLLDTATQIFGTCPLRTASLAVAERDETQWLSHQARQLLYGLDQGAGVLVLTDLYGATTANIATGLLSFGTVQVVSGVNLSMLVRVFNYSNLALLDLAEAARRGGRDGVLICPRPAAECLPSDGTIPLAIDSPSCRDS